MSTENWKPLPSFPSHFDISDKGRVKFKERTVLSTSGRKRHWPERILPLIETSFGYWMVYLWVNGKMRAKKVHSLVLETFVGPKPEGMQCRHLDGNRKNNELTNLRWGTQKENEADKTTHGTLMVGEKHHMSKLTNQQTAEIRKIAAEGITKTKIALMFDVSRTTISLIVNNKIRNKV